MEVFKWIQNNSDLLQTLGVMGSFLLAALAFRVDARARRNANAIALLAEHRATWDPLYSNPDLDRVRQKHVDLDKKPISPQEKQLVMNVILLLSTSYRAMLDGEYVKLGGLTLDVKEFFKLPIPKTIWESIKRFQNADFVAFMEETIHPSL